MFGKPGPEQLKQLNQQTDCWCRIYHINIIYKISVQSNTQGRKGLSRQSSIPEDSFLKAGCVHATGCLTRLGTSEEKQAEGQKVTGNNMRFDSNKVFTV